MKSMKNKSTTYRNMATNPYLDETPRQAPRVRAFPSGRVQPGFVRVERTSYHYGQQGQVTLAHHDVRDLPEPKAIDWLSGEHVAVTWPDGAMELYDLAVTPCRVTSAIKPSFGYITRNGKREMIKLSRLPNVAFDYYRAMQITPKERANFEPHVA